MLPLLAAAFAAHAQERRITDATGRELRLPAKVERVYAAGPPASLLVFAIAPDKLLGWTRAFRADEAAFVPKRYAELPDLGRLTGRGNTANVEVVLKMQPDLIVDVGATAETFASLATRVQQQTGIAYALLDGRFEAMPETLRALGQMLGAQARANEITTYVERSLAEVKDKVAKIPPAARPRVYYGRGPSGLQTGLGGSINVEILEFLGARNVAGGTRGGLATVSIEQILAWDPEVVFTLDPNFYTSVWNDVRWQAVSAVRAKRVFLAPHLPFGWFDSPPGANRILGLYWAGKLMYPAQFQDDLRAKISEFHRIFYQQTPTGAQLDALLGEPGVLPR